METKKKLLIFIENRLFVGKINAFYEYCIILWLFQVSSTKS